MSATYACGATWHNWNTCQFSQVNTVDIKCPTVLHTFCHQCYAYTILCSRLLHARIKHNSSVSFLSIFVWFLGQTGHRECTHKVDTTRFEPRMCLLRSRGSYINFKMLRKPKTPKKLFQRRQTSQKLEASRRWKKNTKEAEIDCRPFWVNLYLPLPTLCRYWQTENC